eukprot:gnl/MRDRNA2_/MRDRNA2_81407_c0_seq1.p1 gnl/MRDRNA2_/MRDRNA2_81407_c0~~gnl/MRDRNA2_/MRDRNA2_81407_c0_seq1.p1  ORF type:complete len:247 (-),score=59.24 gnl/MRDRNA2_/MRDRNA2_81407_c0_seq1:84-824(-)
MTELLLALLLLLSKVNGHTHNVDHGFERLRDPDIQHFGYKVEKMIKYLPEWQQKFVKPLIPTENDLQYDPRIEALHPNNEPMAVARREMEKYFGEKLEEEPADDKQQPTHPVHLVSLDDSPPVQRVEHQTEDDDGEDFLFLCIAIAVILTAFAVASSRLRHPVDNEDEDAGYAKVPTRYNISSDDESGESSINSLSVSSEVERHNAEDLATIEKTYARIQNLQRQLQAKRLQEARKSKAKREQSEE